MSWFRARRVNLVFPHPLSVESATDGAAFELHISGHYTPGTARHIDRESLVRHRISGVAREVCRDFHADEGSIAADALNARLGIPTNCIDRYYWRLTAHARIYVNDDLRALAAQRRADHGRVERLRYLKTALYSDPSLLAVEYLDRDPAAKIDSGRIEELRRYADELRQAEYWWSPLMVAWNELAMRSAASQSTGVAMEILLETIQKFDRSLARKHGLGPDVFPRKEDGATQP